MDQEKFRQHMDCVGLSAKAGGLRTAAMALRKADEQNLNVSMLRLAEVMEEIASDLEQESFALLPSEYPEQ